jgi:beta-lactam-binding protein with PASTA domain
VSCDPNFADVALLLHFDGTNGSTTIVDSSLNGFTTAVCTGAAALTTTDPEFGTACLNIPSSSDFLQINYSGGGPGPSLDIWNTLGDFTIEFWYNPTGTGPANIVQWNDGGGFPNLFLYINGGTSLIMSSGAGQPGGDVNWTLPSGLTPGTWYALAFVRFNQQYYAYLNGAQLVPAPYLFTETITATYTTFQMGGPPNGQEFFVDELRVTQGLARYTASYTPSGPFADNDCGATVPNVVGLLDAAAEAAITAVGLTVGTVVEVPDASAPTTVLSQSPVGGTVVTLPASVDLTESQGIAVPDVVDTSVLVATGILTAAGLTLGAQTIEPSGVVLTGNIISQSPAAGAFAAGGAAVNVVVSGGLPQLTVPDLFGLSQSEAITALLEAGLVPGAIGSAPSQFVPAGEVMAQNPGAGAAVAVGAIVSFVLSTGEPAVGTLFDIEATVISQYANSPTILQLVNNLNQYVDQSTNFANFFNFVWNVDTAVGFGLDIWGVIVNVSRLLRIPTSTDYVGFDNSATPPPDWQTMGSDQPPQPAVGGAMYTGYNATEAYLLPDDAYRQLILAKAFANICTTTAPAINQILQNLYGPGTAFVLNTGPMSISYNLTFTPSAIQLAILQQSGVIPTPPGVSFVINTDV